MRFNSATARLFFSTFRPVIATAAPALARPRAMPSPIPLFPPVTSAVFPRSEKFSISLSNRADQSHRVAIPSIHFPLGVFATTIQLQHQEPAEIHLPEC